MRFLIVSLVVLFLVESCKVTPESQDKPGVSLICIRGSHALWLKINNPSRSRIFVKQGDQKMGDRGATTRYSKDGNTITHWINAEYFEKGSTNEAPLNESGQPIKENPMWLAMYHEIGHGYMKSVLSLSDKEQGGHTVDFENLIRNANSFEKRAYDEPHPKPTTPYPDDPDN
ncbi:MAG: hypothetical protein Q8937_17665 [Bacteroidota bacterium]|nr:hypothetical protein [Bacteroidota bacterium]